MKGIKKSPLDTNIKPFGVLKTREKQSFLLPN